MALKLQKAAVAHARALIGAGKVERSEGWSFSAADAAGCLGDPADWKAYSAWFLGCDPGIDAETKGAYKYPFGKGGKVYRSGVIAAKSRATQQGETALADAAGALLKLIDKAKSLSFREWQALDCPEGIPVGAFYPIVERQADDNTNAAGAPDPRMGGRIKVRMTLSSPDRAKDVVESAGVRVENYLKNPVVLWAHGREGSFPIARCEAVIKGADYIDAVDVFPSAEEDAFANLVYRAIKGGRVNTASIGFNPMKYAKNEDRGGYDFLESDLLEHSFCSVPMHPDAVVLEREFGNVDAALLELADDVDTVDRADVEAILKAFGVEREGHMSLLSEPEYAALRPLEDPVQVADMTGTAKDAPEATGAGATVVEVVVNADAEVAASERATKKLELLRAAVGALSEVFRDGAERVAALGAEVERMLAEEADSPETPAANPVTEAEPTATTPAPVPAEMAADEDGYSIDEVARALTEALGNN